MNQQDAHEALLNILNILHDTTKQLIIPNLDQELIADEYFTSFTRFYLDYLCLKIIYALSAKSHLILKTWKMNCFSLLTSKIMSVT